MLTIEGIFGDRTIFFLAEASFILVFILAYSKEKKWFAPKGSATLTVNRGEISWQGLVMVYGFLSLIILELISTAKHLDGYKTAITILDISILIYLCFFNGWFRNVIISVVSASKNMEES